MEILQVIDKLNHSSLIPMLIRFGLKLINQDKAP